MAKKENLGRQKALVQTLRWMEIFRTIDKKIKNGEKADLESIIIDLQFDWERLFGMGTTGLNRKPKFSPPRWV